MASRVVTEVILVGTIVSLIAWDIYAAIAPPKGDTISEVIWSVAREHPIVAFGCGLLMGHLFWSR
jgi:hypothetical protein